MSDDPEHSRKLASLAFGQAHFPVAVIKESDATIEGLIRQFEACAQVDDDGNDYWFARDLQGLFDYAKWDNFLTVISRAMASLFACRLSS